jgi:hypothetical protein
MDLPMPILNSCEDSHNVCKSSLTDYGFGGHSINSRYYFPWGYWEPLGVLGRGVLERIWIL